MRHRYRALWPAFKLALGLTILVVIGRRFRDDLQRSELWERPMDAGWLVLAGALYLLGLGFSAWYWQRLLRALGERPGMRTIVRAYYIGHFGKYLPGKAWALFLRAGLARAGGISFVPAILTSLYEVLTTMAAGALLATMVFAALTPSLGAVFDWRAVRQLVRLEAPPVGLLEKAGIVPLAFLLLVATGLPLLPAIFNRLVQRRLKLGENVRGADGVPAEAMTAPTPATALPHLRFAWLVEGLALTTIGWLLLGLSLVAVLYAILGNQLQWTAASLVRLPAALALAYVAGFIILVVPSGLGVREFFLTLLLSPELEQIAALEPADAWKIAVLTVIVLRLVWTAAELVIAGVLYLPIFAEKSQHSRALNAPGSSRGEKS